MSSNVTIVSLGKAELLEMLVQPGLQELPRVGLAGVSLAVDAEGEILQIPPDHSWNVPPRLERQGTTGQSEPARARRATLQRTVRRGFPTSPRFRGRKCPRVRHESR
jgi:hypothetical protein